MSTSNAAAIRRRTSESGKQTAPQFSQQQQQPTQQNVNTPSLTLPQIIAVIDKRLINLETFAKDAKENGFSQLAPAATETSSPQDQQEENGVPKEVFNTIVNEYNHRFEILAIEINNLKDVILKLQTFTMDVNKKLVEDRFNSEAAANSLSMTIPPDMDDNFGDIADGTTTYEISQPGNE
jgi:hypothetical protein